MREYSLTVIFIIILICAAAMLTLWVFMPEKGGDTDLSDESSSLPVINSSENNSESSMVSDDTTWDESSVDDTESSEDSDETSGKEINWNYTVDISMYLKYIEPENPESFSALVNKNTVPLSADYVPEQLVLSANARPGREDQCYMNATAAKALEAFLKEAAYYGYDDITVTNAYRSYNTQYYLFYDYYFKLEASKNPGLTKSQIIALVSAYSFPPGQSEHQTGLACDMHNVAVGNQDSFNHSEEAEWLADNAYRFGFILRYPEGKEDITGAIYESWHFRFVGRKLAAYLYVNNITLDEYYEKGYDIYSENQ